MSGGPICTETNVPAICTPGSLGKNDAGDLEKPGYLARLRGVVGAGAEGWVSTGVGGALTAVAAVSPGGPALQLVYHWVARNADQRDVEALERIVRYVANNPGAVADNLKAMGGAAIEAAGKGVTSYDLQQLGYRMASAQYVLFSVMAAGIVWGFLKSIYETIEGIVEIVGDLESFIDDTLEFLEAILSPQGGPACRAIGKEVGASAAERLREISKESYVLAVFHLGEIIGPFVVAIILAYFTAGGGTVAMASGRFAQLLSKIRAIPKASGALDRIRRRLRKKPKPKPKAEGEKLADRKASQERSRPLNKEEQDFYNQLREKGLTPKEAREIVEGIRDIDPGPDPPRGNKPPSHKGSGLDADGVFRKRRKW